MGALQTCTRNITAGNSMQIVSGMEVLKVTFKMSSGASDAGTFQGNGTIRDGSGTELTSQAISLGPSEGFVLQSASTQQPINGLTLSCTTGTLKVVMER